VKFANIRFDLLSISSNNIQRYTTIITFKKWLWKGLLSLTLLSSNATIICFNLLKCTIFCSTKCLLLVSVKIRLNCSITLNGNSRRSLPISVLHWDLFLNTLMNRSFIICLSTNNRIIRLSCLNTLEFLILFLKVLLWYIDRCY
jgi:hypothetical protein